MKRLLLLCLISMIAVHARAQPSKGRPDRAGIINGLLAKQVHAGSQSKTTATAKRLIGYSRYESGLLTDSIHHTYRQYLGSALVTFYDYFDGHLYQRFDAADPLAVQPISADTSFSFTHDGTALAIRYTVINDYDAQRRLTHAVHIGSSETVERFVTSNPLGLRETVIERDSGDGTLPYVDRWKHHFTYDNQNRVVTDSVSSIPTLLPYSKTYYSYNGAGLITGFIRYLIYNGVPEQDYKMDFVYDGSNRLVTATDYYDFGSGWQGMNKDSFGYTGLTAQFTHRQAFNKFLSQWQTRYAHIFELNGTGQVSRMYALEEGVSQLDTVDRFDFQYNAAGLYELLTGAKYQGGGVFGANDLFQHFYYEDYETSGITDKAINKAAFSVYPNPASDRLFIQSAEKSDYTVLDFAGRCLMTVPADKGTQSIDVSALPAGNYIIRDNASNAYQQFSIIH